MLSAVIQYAFSVTTRRFSGRQSNMDKLERSEREARRIQRLLLGWTCLQSFPREYNLAKLHWGVFRAHFVNSSNAAVVVVISTVLPLELFFYIYFLLILFLRSDAKCCKLSLCLEECVHFDKLSK